MRVAYISMDGGIPLFGNKGASNHVREFARAMAGLGCQVTIFTARTGEPQQELPCRVRAVPAIPVDGDLPTAVGAEVAALRRNDSLRNALVSEQAREPFDLLIERYSLWSYAAWEFAEMHGAPFVLEVNSPLRLEQKRYRELRLEPAAELIERVLFRSATLVAGVSRPVIDYVISRSGRTLPVTVLPNGADLDLFREMPPRRGGGFRVGFAGSLKPWHGLEVLLEAFAILAVESPEYRLLVVGDGPVRASIEQYARAHSLDGRMHLTGAVEKHRIPEFLAEMDVAVAPYPNLQDFYFSPLKIYEYMAAGRAIVASDIGQVSEVLKDGRTALLAEAGSASDLAAKIRRMRQEPALREALAMAAREAAFRCHGWENRTASLLDAVGAACGENAGSGLSRPGFPLAAGALRAAPEKGGTTVFLGSLGHGH